MNNDQFTVNVFGIDANGTRVNQFPSGGRTEFGSLDLSGIDATEFPRLEIAFDFTDNTNLTPPQLDFWHVQFENAADGVLLLPESSEVSIQEGDTIRRDFYFFNYTDQSFTDSVRFTTLLRDTGDGSLITFEGDVLAPASGDSAIFRINESSLGRVGTFALSARATPESPELYTVNNTVNLSSFLRVEGDNLNPVLDVTFDGVYILNGDIISPNPLINILIKDQNALLLKSDTTGINISLRVGDDGQFNRIPFSSSQIEFSPATPEQDFTIQYQPGPLEDNRYALRVEATDESGNLAGRDPYEIAFEVINESTITYFYPYPNPFSTSTRFVFTLTGSEVPDEMKIQIFTVTGRVVREILQDEIGPIRIGNNITQFAWDGRDEFGDQLANGVYFYRVISRVNGEDVANRQTSADQAFRHGYGKLYILR